MTTTTTTEETVPKVRVSVAEGDIKKVSISGTKCCSGSKCGAEPSNSTSTSTCCDAQNQSLVPSDKPTTKAPPRLPNQIPEDILNDAALNDAISVLPSHYNFEVHKSVWFCRKNNVKRVALQMPEGLHLYALVLCDILQKFGGCQDAIIMADVAYGACCIDDYTAVALGCDYIIHYGHSCLIPITQTKIPVLYVFVEIRIQAQPIIETLLANFRGKRLALMATVQFVAVLHEIKEYFSSSSTDSIELYIPQIRPLSPGEVLGCTAPRLPQGTDALFFVADGRFHLEAAMIANPTVPAYRYDPFTGTTFREQYDHELMLQTRQRLIEKAKSAHSFGVILGTLGRQGNQRVMDDIVAKLKQRGKRVTVFLMSEVRPETLQKLSFIEAWVQTSCPRLSIDWNYTFGEEIPILTPYEFNVMLGVCAPFRTTIPPQGALDDADDQYPMDFYATGDAATYSGPWTPGYQLRPPRKTVDPLKPSAIKSDNTKIEPTA